jgi:hypothetical protein
MFVISMDELSMPVTLSCDDVDHVVRGVQLDSSVGNLSGEVFHAVVNNDVGFVWMVVRVVGMVCCAVRRFPRLRQHDPVEAGWRLVQLVLVRPEWRVMMSERKAAGSAASFWVLKALRRRILGLMVAGWWVAMGVMPHVTDGYHVMRFGDRLAVGLTIGGNAGVDATVGAGEGVDVGATMGTVGATLRTVVGASVMGTVGASL